MKIRKKYVSSAISGAISGAISIVVLVATILLMPRAARAAATKELGFNVHQSSTVGLAATKDAGVKWVRIDLNWYNAEPTQQGQYDWAIFDAVIDAAIAKNLQVLAVVGYTPAWASQGDAKGGGNQNDVPNAGTFAPFVTAVVNRYKAKVTHYEIWNEPNLGQFFEGTPQDYIDRILVPGADAVHAACAACKVVGPGLATVGDQYGIWMDAVLGQAKAKIDIVSGHIYASFPTPGGGAGVTSDSFFNKLESHRVIKVGGATLFEGPLSFKEVIDKHGVTAPFWLTETGQEATRGNAAEEDAQTTTYRRTLEEMLQRPWWQATIFYEAFDEPPAPYRWGAVVHDESAPNKYLAKPVHDFLKKVTAAQPAFGGTKTDCDDGLDNDLDGQIDFPSDTQCKAATSASEGLASLDGGLPPVVNDGGASSSTTSSSSGSSSGGSPNGPSASSGSSGDAPTSESDTGCTAGSSTPPLLGSSPSGAIALAILAGAAIAGRRQRRRKNRG